MVTRAPLLLQAARLVLILSVVGGLLLGVELGQLLVQLLLVPPMRVRLG